MFQTTLNIAYIMIGGNLGNRLHNLEEAKKGITMCLGSLKTISSIYQTAAWGFSDQPDFLNQALIVETPYSAPECLERILDIENSMGRIRTVKNAPRLIDIDLLFYNNLLLNIPGLIIPHPEIQNRLFVLKPLNEIDPFYIHPLLNKTIKSLLAECKDELEVSIINNDLRDNQ